MLDILPSGCKTQKFSEFYRHRFDAIRGWDLYL